MRKTAIAVLAAATMLSSAALAQPGNGKGNGNGNGNGKGGGKPAAAAQGNPGKAMKQQGRKVDKQVQRNVERRVERRVERANPGNGNGKIKGNGNGNANRNVRVSAPVERVVERTVRYGDTGVRRVVRDAPVYRVAADGCPPGLAKKYNGCMPPGLAKKQVRTVYYDQPDWWGYSGLPSGRYRYDDGYLFSLNRDNRISGFVPLLAGALGLGEVWPTYYEPQPLDSYYRAYYDLGPQGYRYADDVIYRVDPETAVINSVAALLTGDQFTVGQRMPAGYGIYNVPYDYRDRYYDTPTANYRYADGYIYEVDPETQLIAAAISLLT